METPELYAATEGKIYSGISISEVHLGDNETGMCINITIRATSPFIGTPCYCAIKFREQIRIDVISRRNGAYASEIADIVEAILHRTTSVSYGGTIVYLGMVGEMTRITIFDNDMMAWRVALTPSMVGSVSIQAIG
jgi:hypothetical protein